MGMASLISFRQDSELNVAQSQHFLNCPKIAVGCWSRTVWKFGFNWSGCCIWNYSIWNSSGVFKIVGRDSRKCSQLVHLVSFRKNVFGWIGKFFFLFHVNEMRGSKRIYIGPSFISLSNICLKHDTSYHLYDDDSALFPSKGGEYFGLTITFWLL